MNKPETVGEMMRRFEERQHLKAERAEHQEERSEALGLVLPDRAERRRREREAERAKISPAYL